MINNLKNLNISLIDFNLLTFRIDLFYLDLKKRILWNIYNSKYPIHLSINECNSLIEEFNLNDLLIDSFIKESELLK